MILSKFYRYILLFCLFCNIGYTFDLIFYLTFTSPFSYQSHILYVSFFIWVGWIPLKYLFTRHITFSRLNILLIIVTHLSNTSSITAVISLFVFLILLLYLPLIIFLP